MTDFLFRYRLQEQPAARIDGSGMIDHQIQAICLPEDSPSEEEWKSAPMIPGRHKTIVVPYTEMNCVMDMPDATGSQRAVKNAAYKTMLANNLNTTATPILGWDKATLELVCDNQLSSISEAQRADDYITGTLGQTYPVTFSI